MPDTSTTTLLSTIEVCRRTGATYRQVDYWVRAGLVVPEVGATGSGSARRWTVEQVTRVNLLRVIVDAFTTSGPRPNQTLLDALGRFMEVEPGVLWLEDAGVTITIQWDPDA